MGGTQSAPPPPSPPRPFPPYPPRAQWQRTHDEALEATNLLPEVRAIVWSYLPKSPSFEELLAMTVLDQFLDFVPKRVTYGSRVYEFEWSRETRVPSHVLLCAAGIALECDALATSFGAGGISSCSRLQKAELMARLAEAIDTPIWLSATGGSPHNFVKMSRTTPIVNALADVATVAELEAAAGAANDTELSTESPRSSDAIAQLSPFLLNGWYVYHSHKSGYWIVARSLYRVAAAALSTQAEDVPCRALRLKWSSSDTATAKQ